VNGPMEGHSVKPPTKGIRGIALSGKGLFGEQP